MPNNTRKMNMPMLKPPCCLEMLLLMDVTTTSTRLCMKKMARRP